MKYINSPICYMGNKYKQLEILIPALDKSKCNYIDLFAGAGSVFANAAKYYSKVYINDIVAPLIDLHKLILDDTSRFKQFINNIYCKERRNKDLFYLLRDAFNQQPTPERLYCLIQLSALNSLKFNNEGKVNSSFGYKKLFENIEEKTDRYVNHLSRFRKNLNFSSLSFEKFQVPQNSMVFIDPPYSNSFAGYNKLWSSNHDKMLLNYINEIDRSGNSFLLCGTVIHKGRINKLLSELIVKRGYSYSYLKNPKFKGQTVEIFITNYLLPNSGELVYEGIAQ